MNTTNNFSLTSEQVKDGLLRAFTRHDAARKGKSDYNRHGFMVMVNGLDRTTDAVMSGLESGLPIRSAVLKAGFSGRLATAVLKIFGEKAITKEEGRGQF